MRCYICDAFTTDKCILCNRYICTRCAENMICKKCKVKNYEYRWLYNKDNILLILGVASIIVGFLMIVLGSIDTKSIDNNNDNFIYIFPFIFIKGDLLLLLPLLILLLLLPLLFIILFIRKIM